MSLKVWTRRITPRLRQAIGVGDWDPFRLFENGVQTFAEAAMEVIEALTEDIATIEPDDLGEVVEARLRDALHNHEDVEAVVRKILSERDGAAEAAQTAHAEKAGARVIQLVDRITSTSGKRKEESDGKR